MRRAAGRRRGRPGGGPQDRHGRLLRPQGLHGARGAPGHRGAPRGPEPVLQHDARGAREARRHRGEVHRRRDHGRLRAAPAPRGRRAPRRPGRGRDAGSAGRVERGVRGGLRRPDREPHRREHRRGGRGGRQRRTPPRHWGHREHGRSPRAERPDDGDPPRRIDVPPGEGRGRGRACRAAGAEGQSGTDARLPTDLGRPPGGGSRPPARRPDRRARGGARGPERRPRSGDRETPLSGRHRRRARRDREVTTAPGVHGSLGCPNPPRTLSLLRRGTDVLAARRDRPHGGRDLERRPRGRGAAEARGSARRRCAGRHGTDRGGDRPLQRQLPGGGDVLGSPAVLRADLPR